MRQQGLIPPLKSALWIFGEVKRRQKAPAGWSIGGAINKARSFLPRDIQFDER